MADEKEYQVKKILDHTYREGKHLYLIEWEGYGSDENTWEPLENLNCPNILRQFERRRKTAEKERTGNKEKAADKKRKATTDPQPSTSGARSQKKKSPQLSKSNNGAKINKTSFMASPSPSSTQPSESSHSELQYSTSSVVCEQIGTPRFEKMNGNHYSRNDRPVHDLDDDLISVNDYKKIPIKEKSDSDEYDFTDDDDKDNGSPEYKLAFHLPTRFKTSNIIGMVSIKKQKYFVFQFDGNKIYYVDFKVANEKFKELVKNFYDQKAFSLDDQIRDDF